MKRTLIAQVEDKPGVLTRVASLFRRRAFNIESLTVGHTEQPGISRMTIVVDSSRTDSEKVAQHLCKLVNVIRVEDITDQPAVMRDLALIKVETNGGQTRPEVLQIVETFRAKVVDVGLDTLMAEAGIRAAELETFIVAGAFGTYISVPSAIRIGMFPAIPLERYRQVGNAAGMGAKQLLLSAPLRETALRVARRVEYVELTTHPDFQRSFVQRMYLNAN